MLIQHLPRFINLYAGLFRTRVCGGEIADGSFEVRMPQPTHERPNRHTSFMVERCIGSPEFVKAQLFAAGCHLAGSSTFRAAVPAVQLGAKT